MNEKDVINLPTMEAFNNLLDSLNLTDRQRRIFELRYSRGLFQQDIAAEIDVDRKTVVSELKIIKEKLRFVTCNNLTNS